MGDCRSGIQITNHIPHPELFCFRLMDKNQVTCLNSRFHGTGQDNGRLYSKQTGKFIRIYVAVDNQYQINNNYRYRVTLCATPGGGFRRLVADTVIRAGGSKLFKGVNVYADTNPTD